MTGITYKVLKQLIDKKESYILIDVREKDELKYGIIPTSSHVPLNEFLKAIDLPEEELKRKYGITKKDKLILYCRSGNRSGYAAKIARQKGFKADYYEGSIPECSKDYPNVKAY